MKKLFLILVSAALLATANYSLAKQENPYREGTGSYELPQEQRDFLIQYINQSKKTLEDAVAMASSQDLYTSFQTLLTATKKAVKLSSTFKPRDELLFRTALNQALELTVGIPNSVGAGYEKKGVLASSVALSSNIDLYNIILSDSINLALKYSEFDSKAVASSAFTELPYDKFSMERLQQFRQWSAFFMPEPTSYKFLRTGLTQWLSSMNPKYLLTKNAEYAESLVSAQDELNSSTLEKNVNRVRKLKNLIDKILNDQFEREYSKSSWRERKNLERKTPTHKSDSYSTKPNPLNYSNGSKSLANGYSYNQLIGNINDKNSLAYKKAGLLEGNEDQTVSVRAFGKAGTFTNAAGVPSGLDLKLGLGIAPAKSSGYYDETKQMKFNFIRLGVDLALNLDLTKHFGTEDSVNHFDVDGQFGFATGTYFVQKNGSNIGFLNFKVLNAEATYTNELADPKTNTRFGIASETWNPELEFHTFFPLTQAVTGEFCFLTTPMGVGGAQVVRRINDAGKFVNTDQFNDVAFTTKHSLCFSVNVLGYAEIKDQVSSKFLIFLPDEKDERSFLMNITNELSVNRIGGPNSPFGAYYEYSQNRYMKDDLKNDEIKTIYTVNRHMFGIKLEY